MNFRRAVSDILQPKHDDKFLLRWLRARSWDVEAAEKMLRTNLEWRKEWDLDELVKSWQPPEPLASHYPSGLSGFDKEGYPIYIVPMGNLDMIGLLHTTSKQDMIRLTIKTLEEILLEAERNGVTQLVAIFDLENFNLRQFAWKPAVELVITLLQSYEANYPEILKVCYIINAPKLFALAYAVVKKFINEYTQSKIKIYKQESTKWQTHLFEHVSPDNLPKCYGGSMVDPDGDPRCPSLIKPGKIVSKALYKKNLTDEVLVNRDYVTTTVKKGKQLALDFFISDPGSLLQWDFRTEDHDIRFGVTYTDENGNVHKVINPSRTSANLVDVTGTITCKAPATYTVIFDNSYSKFRSKTLHYYVAVVENLSKLDIESSPEARMNQNEPNVIDEVVVH
ncbi:hypothetical protein Trydic_g18157 [Trypoxylus dichotomus]